MDKNSIQEFLNICCPKVNSKDFLIKMENEIKKINQSEQFQFELNQHKALDNKIRLLIYKLLEGRELCTCALAEILKVSEGTITHHLKKLDEANLIVGRKKGYFTVYYTKENIREKIKE